MLLSICIPTHDGRAWTLRETIDSVLPQIIGRYEGLVQICVSDNGSRDETAALLAEYAAAHPGIFTLHRFEENQGGYVNQLKVVEMAKGEFCWFLGSDDQLTENAVSTVINLLNEHPSITGITCNWDNYDRRMIQNDGDWGEWLIPSPNAVEHYQQMEAAMEALGLYLKFISAQVFRRSIWNKVVAQEGFERIKSYRHYMHIFVLGRVITEKPDWLWCATVLVKRRGMNDTTIRELGRGLHGFMMETSEDLLKSWRDILGDKSPSYRLLVDKFLRQWFSPRVVADWKRMPSHNQEADRQLTKFLIESHGFQLKFWLLAYPHLVVPESFHKLRIRAGIGGKIRNAISYVNPRNLTYLALVRLKVDNHWTKEYARRLMLLKEIKDRQLTAVRQREQEIEQLITKKVEERPDPLS